LHALVLLLLGGALLSQVTRGTPAAVSLEVAGVAAAQDQRTVSELKQDGLAEEPSLPTPAPIERLPTATATPTPLVEKTPTPPRQPADWRPPAIANTPVPASDAQRLRISQVPSPPASALICEAAHVTYCVYTVKPGDTLGHIALRFGIPNVEVMAADLLVASNKPDIVSAEDFILPGQKLRIPTRRGIVHTVILDDTIEGLAEYFDVNPAAIIATNGLSNGILRLGQTILIPSPGRIAPPPPPAPEPVLIPAPPPPPVFAFRWPLNRAPRITSFFGPRHPLGIDIGLAEEPRAPIMAVESGKVTFVGGDPCCSYGLYVIVDHQNGLKTLYAHLRQFNVANGQWVSKGDVLGLAGSTGYSTGPHLHFEVHRGDKRIDPLTQLPR
jgi:murein DD-endopeptidase MepM/ murein hydrolase activator NlpD